MGALAAAGPGLAGGGVRQSPVRVPGWPTRCTRAQPPAGHVHGGGVGGSSHTPSAPGPPLPARAAARPRGVPDPPAAALLRPRPARQARLGFRLTSLCLEFAAASPGARSQFHGLWARRGARDRKPGRARGKGTEGATETRTSRVVGQGVCGSGGCGRRGGRGAAVNCPGRAGRVCRRGHVCPEPEPYPLWELAWDMYVLACESFQGPLCPWACLSGCVW